MIKFILNNIPRKTLHRFADKAMPIAAILFYGDKIECPVCKKRFRKMLGYGYKEVRKNALCPNCLSLERHRMMWHYLQNETTFFTEKISVLHVAPEAPFIKKFETIIAKNNGEYITADLESPWAKVKMDVEQIPFEDNTFDVIICNHVLEHVNDDKKAIREIFRALKKGGYAILLSPIDYSRETTFQDSSITDENERLRLFGQKDHLRVYGKDYKERLASVGFNVKEVNYKETLSKELFNRYAFSSEILYITNKP